MFNWLRQTKSVRVVQISLAAAMFGVIVVTLHFLQPVNAEFNLVPRWLVEPRVGDTSVYQGPWATPIQNTSSSRLFVYTDDIPGGDRNNYVFRVNDDGSAVLGSRLVPALNLGVNEGNNFGFVSDKTDGAYVGWTTNVPAVGYNNNIVRVGPNGNLLWSRIDDTAIGVSEINSGQFLAVDQSGNALVAYYRLNTVCAMKLSKATGASLWSVPGVSNCNVGNRRGKVIYSASNSQVRGLASDGQGGAIILHGRSVSELGATRTDSSGNVLWTVTLADGTGGNPTGIELLTKDTTTFYGLWRKGTLNYVQAFNTSDGSAQWPSALQFADSNSYSPSNQFDQSKFVFSGPDELTTAWIRTSDGALAMNRINLENGQRRWASDVVVTTEAEDSNYRLTGPAQGVVFAAYCHDNVPSDSAICEMQAVSVGGDLLFHSDGVEVRRSRPQYMQLGLHTVNSASSQSYCLDEGFHRQGESVGAQSYCLAGTPTITDPICSIDNGGNFVLCTDAQQGRTVSHVQVTCDPGDFIPLSEAVLANTPNLHEDSAFIENRYVVYRYFISGHMRVYAYDLGPDERYGTADDGGQLVLVNEGGWNSIPQDLKDGRMLYSRNAGGADTLRFYNLDTGTTDPGTLTGVALGRTGFDGRYLVYTPNGTGDILVKDLGADEILGTADDGGSTQLNTTQMHAYVRVSGRYAVSHDNTGGRDDIYLFDLINPSEMTVYSNASVQADVPEISGRYIVWMDYRNDPDGADIGTPPSNADIFLYDMGPDAIFGNGDDLGEFQVSTSGKKDSSPRISGTKILWHQTQNEGQADAHQDVLMYDLGADGVFGTADDSLATPITTGPNSEYWARSSGDTIVWLSDQNGPANTDIFISPAGFSSVGIDEVRFTMTSPSGDRYVDQVADDIDGTTYTLYHPITIDEEGEWSLTAECEDTAGQIIERTSVWDVGPWPFSDQQKLSVYDGVAQISANSGDTMEIGNAGRDIASNGRIYIRPNNSYAGAYFEGVADNGSQRLHFPFGIPGQHTLFAKGTGTVDGADGASGIAALFQGLGNDAGGSGVYGEVMSCAASGGCSAGYFQGGSQIGLYASSANAAVPALRSENAALPNPSTQNVSASFTGKVQVTQDVSAALTLDSCAWVTVNVGDIVCPNEGVVYGYDATTPGVNDRLYCCGN